MKNNTLAKYAAMTVFGTSLSRIIGFIRDMIISRFLGTGLLSDVLFISLRIPSVFRRMFGEGAFSVAFIPTLNEYLYKKNKKEIQTVLNVVFTTLLLAIVAISTLGIFFSSFFVKLIAGGFANNPQKMQLAIDLTKLVFPFITFICLATFLLATLNTLHSFFIPSLAPAAIGLSEIFYIFTVASLFTSNAQIKGLVTSIVIGWVLWFFIQYQNLKSLNWKLNFELNLRHPVIKKVLFLIIPSIVGLSVDQVNIIIDNRCASSLGQGAVSALYYANRLMQMPLAIFGFAIASASLPTLSKAHIQKDMTAFKNSFSDSIRFTNFTLIPASAGLMATGIYIIKLLFEGGKFNASSSIMTNEALFYYSLGLPAYALVKIFVNAFYSFQDTKTPIKVAVVTIILHIVLCIVLMHPLGVGGLALATAISSYVNFILLVFYMRQYMKQLELKQIFSSFLKTLFASFVAGIVAWYVCKSLNKPFIAVFIAMISGLAIFIIVLYILRSEELKAIYKMLICRSYKNRKAQ
jgi:putative peptidoglycan lipid II flippase